MLALIKILVLTYRNPCKLNVLYLNESPDINKKKAMLIAL